MTLASDPHDWDDTPDEPDWLAQQRREAARHATDADAPDDLLPEDRPPAWPPAPPAPPAPAVATPPTLTVVQNTDTNAKRGGIGPAQDQPLFTETPAPRYADYTR